MHLISPFVGNGKKQPLSPNVAPFGICPDRLLEPEILEIKQKYRPFAPSHSSKPPVALAGQGRCLPIPRGTTLSQ